MALPGRVLAFKPEGHEALVDSAFPGMKPAQAAQLKSAISWPDAKLSFSFGRDKHHFNDCGFEVGAEYIQGRYKALGEALAKNDSDDALEAFGQILHAIQDFYAHSNWSDSGLTVLVTDFADRSGAAAEWPPWPPMPPGLFGGAVVLADSHAEGWTFERTGRRVTARSRDGRVVPAIMTGEVAGPTRCPSAIVLGHWDAPSERGGLSKDEPGRPGYEAAKAIALRQTRREVCRLITRTPPGHPGRATLASWFETGKLDELGNQCKPGSWAWDPEGVIADAQDHGEPSGAGRSDYARLQAGMNVGYRYVRATGSTVAVGIDLRSRYLGVAVWHDAHDPIEAAFTWAPWGRSWGLFLSVGGGWVRVSQTEPSARHAFSGNIAYELGPWANALGGTFSAIRLAAGVMSGPDDTGRWATTFAVNGGVRFGAGLP
jgi:hypothetical protein